MIIVIIIIFVIICEHVCCVVLFWQNEVLDSLVVPLATLVVLLVARPQRQVVS